MGKIMESLASSSTQQTVAQINHRPFPWAAIKILALLAYFQLIACDIGYYAHLARAGSNNLANPAEAWLQTKEGVPDSLKSSLSLSIYPSVCPSRAKQQESIHHLLWHGGFISWNVSAAPRIVSPLYWHFPLGEALQRVFQSYRAGENTTSSFQGYDVLLRPVSAYSTLGYLSDPLLSTMLSYPPHVLTDLILHELTHATMYAKGHTDFNESVATFIGQEGARQFLSQHYGEDNPYLRSALEEKRDRERFRFFLKELTETLDSLYQASTNDPELLTKRKQVFNLAQGRFKETLPLYSNQGYEAFLHWEINNARLLSYRRYNSKQNVFHRIHDSFEGDLSQSIPLFSQCCKTEDPWKCLDFHDK